MNWSDMYQNDANSANGTGTLAQGAYGPNQSIVTGPSASSPSGSLPAFSWLGLVLALVLLRVLISMGGKVG